MKRYLPFIFLFFAFISGCDKIKSFSGFGKDEVAFDTILLKKIADSIVANAKKQNFTYCDSSLVQFNNVELAKQYPELVATAFNWDLLSHGGRNARVFKEFDDLVSKSGSEHLKAWSNYLMGRSEQNAGNDKEAIQFYLAAITGFEKYNDTSGFIASNRRLGGLYRRNASDYKRALIYFKRILQIHNNRILQIPNDSFEINTTLGEIHECYKWLNMPDSVVYYLAG